MLAVITLIINKRKKVTSWTIKQHDADLQSMTLLLCDCNLSVITIGLHTGSEQHPSNFCILEECSNLCILHYNIMRDLHLLSISTDGWEAPPWIQYELKTILNKWLWSCNHDLELYAICSSRLPSEWWTLTDVGLIMAPSLTRI